MKLSIGFLRTALKEKSILSLEHNFLIIIQILQISHFSDMMNNNEQD